MNSNTCRILAGICRWSARVLGTLLVVIMVAIAVGEGMPNPLTQPLPVRLGFLGLGLILAGFLGGWRWEVAGGVISLTGWVVFVLAVIRFPRGPNMFVCALALPAVLYLASGLLRGGSQQPSSAVDERR